MYCFLRTHVSSTLSRVEKDFRSKTGLDPSSEVTFVGVHNRRTDYLSFRKRRLGLDSLRDDYFEASSNCD
jgi:hypothetical protein